MKRFLCIALYGFVIVSAIVMTIILVDAYFSKDTAGSSLMQYVFDWWHDRLE